MAPGTLVTINPGSMAAFDLQMEGVVIHGPLEVASVDEARQAPVVSHEILQVVEENDGIIARLPEDAPEYLGGYVALYPGEYEELAA